MALLDNAPPILREMLNWSDDQKTAVGEEVVSDMISEITSRYGRDTAMEAMLALVMYAVSADHKVSGDEVNYFNSVFTYYRRFYSLEEFSRALKSVNSGFYYDQMFKVFRSSENLQTSSCMLFWLFVVCNGTVTADELDTFGYFQQRLING